MSTPGTGWGEEIFGELVRKHPEWAWALGLTPNRHPAPPQPAGEPVPADAPETPGEAA